MADRHSKTEAHVGGLPLLTDAEIAAHEARNGLLQFDAMNDLIARAVDEQRFELTREHICRLQELAVQGLEATAGQLRTSPVTIGGTAHVPPPAAEVPRLVGEMCEYLRVHWSTADALELAAYAMWRMNWIHPFTNGNGRTSRAVSYLVLCAKLGFHLPGKRSVPEMISTDKDPYYEALEAADAAWKQGRCDVSQMKRLLHDLLRRQLTV